MNQQTLEDIIIVLGSGVATGFFMLVILPVYVSWVARRKGPRAPSPEPAEQSWGRREGETPEEQYCRDAVRCSLFNHELPESSVRFIDVQNLIYRERAYVRAERDALQSKYDALEAASRALSDWYETTDATAIRGEQGWALLKAMRAALSTSCRPKP
jgi:hypothetical protein